MIFEDLEIIWRDEQSHPSHTIDDEALRLIVLGKAREYRRKIFWRDSSDIGVHAIVVALLFGVGLWVWLKADSARMADMIPLLVVAVGYSFAISVRFVGRLHQKQREKEFDDSVRGNLQKLLANAEYQIRLQRNFTWWYILPIVPGYLLIVSAHWSSGPAAFWFMAIFTAAIFACIYWGNVYGLRTDLIPQKEELEAMLAGLENGGKSAAIRGLAESDSPSISPIRKNLSVALAALIFAAVLTFLGVVFWPAEEPQAPSFGAISAFNESKQAEIDSWLQQTVERSHYPSLSVAIVRDGTIVYHQTFGFENLWNKTPATTNTAYHVASVTKVFTATLAALLHERGVVDLDAPVTKYLPSGTAISDSLEQGAKITLRQLASHTSGLPRRVPGKVQSVEWRYELEPQRLYALLSAVTLESEPGTRERYSNLGFGLLGHVLELAANKPLNELIQEHLCEPLNLKHTAIHVDGERPIATGYTTPPRLPERHSYKQRLAGSGGLVTSAGDLAKFLAAQMKPGVFSSNTLAQLHNLTKLNDGSPSTHGLGWHADYTQPFGRLLKKNGGRGNCSAWIGFAPDHGVGVAVISNIGDPDVDPIGEWLLARSIPGWKTAAPKIEHPKLAPFTAVRWEAGDKPTVRIRGEWLHLTAIDDIPIDRLLQTARKEFGPLARKRFTEDLVELLHLAGHKPGSSVTLMLDRGDGKGPVFFKEEMTEDKRWKAKNYEER